MDERAYLKQLSDELVMNAKMWDREPTSIYMQPNFNNDGTGGF
jgi:hypothetical protein